VTEAGTDASKSGIEFGADLFRVILDAISSVVKELSNCGVHVDLNGGLGDAEESRSRTKRQLMMRRGARISACISRLKIRAMELGVLMSDENHVTGR
jgi:hypothetical protein